MSNQQLIQQQDQAAPADAEHITDSAPAPAGMHAVATMTVGHAHDPAESAADELAASALARLRRESWDEPGAASDDDGARGAATTAINRMAADAPGGSPASSTTAGPVVGEAGGQLDPGTSGAIAARRGHGRPLAAPVRRRMESAFGTNLGHVKIHDDDHAAQLSTAISARAFTTGSDIFFGAGQFVPDTATGEFVLAHELAHVVGGGAHTTAQRWSLFGKKNDDPAKKLAAEKAKEDKARKKEEVRAEKERQKEKSRADKEKKKQDAEEKKQKKAAAKARANESKKNEKVEKSRLSSEQKRGSAQRAKSRDEVIAEMEGGATTPATLSSLKERFADALEEEQAEINRLQDEESLDPEAAAAAAYRTVWLETDDEALRSHRPPRETAAERLTAAVRSARTAAGVQETTAETIKQGSLLPAAVEEVYEKFVAAVDDLMGPPTNFSPKKAEAAANITIWNVPSHAKAKKQRPETGSAVDEQAKKDARQRLNLRPDPPETKPQDEFDKAEGKVDTVGGYLGHVGTVAGGAQSILAKAGEEETAELQKGLKPDSGGGGSTASKIPVIGGFIGGVEKAKERVAKGKKEDDPEEILPVSVKTQASQGIEASTGILNNLLETAKAAIRFAKAVKKAHNDRSPRNIMAATKAGADAATKLNDTAKGSASLAAIINPGVAQSVARVIPGLDIVASVMAMVKSAMNMGHAATRVQDTDESLFSARSKESDSNTPDVMIYPLLRVLQSYTMGLEQTVWDTAMAVKDFATGVATLATGGGFGIPAAVKLGGDVLNNLHKAGRVIAGEMLVAITKKAQVASLERQEGAAENQLAKDPAMAVDGIIISAAGGDPIAQQFLTNYELDGDQIGPEQWDTINVGADGSGDATMLLKIRAVVLKEMGDDAEPEFLFNKYKNKAGSLLSTLRDRTTGRWAAAGKLANDRNSLDGDDKKGKRGYFWRVKMLKKDPEEFERSQRKTAVTKDAASDQPAQKLPESTSQRFHSINDNGQIVEAVCGDLQLLLGSSERQQEVFTEEFTKLPDDVLLAATKDRNNPPEWQQLFRDLLSERALQEASGKGALV